MSSSSSDDSPYDEEAFEWNKYLMVRNAEEVPDDFFNHVCKSEQNGIDLGSFVEIESEDQTGYWFASVCSSNGVLINLHYFGDESDKHDFWLEVKSPRIHSLNWGSENNKNLIPPYPDTFFRVNPEIIKEKVEACEHVVSNAVLKMGGAPIYKIFKPGMFVEVQDKEFPYRVWVTKIIQNVGGRLFLTMEGPLCPEKEPFWLFYMNDRIFPLGWAEQKGLPWIVMNSNIKLENVNDSTSLLNVLKPKTPGQHTYKVGEMLEVLNPYSLMVFYVGTIVKIYDNRYFKIELDNDSDVHKRITFVATKENPHLFEPGWASKHKFVLKPPSDWTTSNVFCWPEYASMKNSKLANFDHICKKQIDNVNIGMKLEAVDPIDPSCIRVATVKGFADYWMFLSFDRTNWCQELLHVRSVYSDDVFPVGWCNKHKYVLRTPKLPLSDCQDFKNCYYVSDVEINFDDDDLNNESVFLKYPSYFKGDLPYHFSKNTKSFEDNLEESIEHVLNANDVESSNISQIDNDQRKDVVKVELPELDEEFHDALFLEGEANAKNSVEKEEGLVTVKKEIDEIEKEEVSTLHKTLYTNNNHEVCIYFNKNCRPGRHITRKKICDLPDKVGPGLIPNILQKAVTNLINVCYFPVTFLKKIVRNQNLLLDGPGGVPMKIHANVAKSHSIYSEYITLPESKKMAQLYCSAFCNFNGMCEYFMTTEKTPCPTCCNVRENICSKPKPIVKVSKKKTNKRKYGSDKSVEFNDLFKKRSTFNHKIAKVAKEHLDWTNIPLVKNYQYYLSGIIHYEYLTREINELPSPQEMVLIESIYSKKQSLKLMDELDDYKITTKSEHRNIIDKTIDKNDKKFVFMIDWKYSLENYYRNDQRFKYTEIDIGDYEKIKITTNPKYWSPDDVFKYLSSDQTCSEVAKMLMDKEVDGVAFLILTEDQLLNYLKFPINLAIRIMCHIAEAKYICFTEYIDT